MILKHGSRKREARVFARTESVCPVCLNVIEAKKTVGSDGNIYLNKSCPEHGDFSVLIWEGSLDSYLAWDKTSSKADTPPSALSSQRGCPYDCGLCEKHERPGCCVLLEITSRCDLGCPVCFASAGSEKRDPGLDELASLYDMLSQRGGPFNIQLSGGEPTMRDDLPEIIALGRERGFSFFQLNTNGLRLARENGYAEKLRKAGVSCVFLQFDGMSEAPYIALRGRELLSHKKRTIENCTAAGLPVVLVPTVAPGINEQELGAILRFAMDKAPSVRGVHFQPISYFGRYDQTPPKMRITIPRILRLIDEQTEGFISAGHFSGGGAESAYCSFHAAYMRNADGSFRPLLAKRSGCCCTKSSDTRDYVAERWSAAKSDAPQDAFDEFLAQTVENTFTVSGMLFQDAWTLDLSRLRRCYINEADSRYGMVPFCAYNLTDTSGRSLYRK